ncbi:hypothetical protein JAAARDRAFT_408742 [Jaapia argillacea MUCL 33604]|uniref:Uncharacterized protein n=1 Tax=Jaapia argillacea MUCL 33604 TaxID=933084 RepID=A0A067PGJ4_9AGAM|nr:hypothetical protein JAAARDRAFT_408742 [Jaapia argillacea MUCL 33604]
MTFLTALPTCCISPIDPLHSCILGCDLLRSLWLRPSLAYCYKIARWAYTTSPNSWRALLLGATHQRLPLQI